MATKDVLLGLILQIQNGISSLPDDTPVETLDDLKGKLEAVVALLPAAEVQESEGASSGGLGGRRRSAKKRGTQRKQKRRQRRGSRRAY